MFGEIVLVWETRDLISSTLKKVGDISLERLKIFLKRCKKFTRR